MRRRKTHSEFLEEILDRNLTVLDTYITSSIKLRFKCKKCDGIWSATPHNILRGRGRPHCSHLGTNTIIKHFEDGSVLVDISTPTYPDATSRLDFDVFCGIRGRMSITSRGYVQTYNGSANIHVQSLVIDCPDDMERDHINRDKSDNRLCNLRIVTSRQNQQNHGLEYPGAHATISGRWATHIQIGSKIYYLGTFDTPSEASSIYFEADKHQQVSLEALINYKNRLKATSQ